jgi:hypothetical protein
MERDCVPTADKPAYDLSVKESLLSRRRRLEEQLLDINTAIEALETHPEIEQILTLLAKV